MKVYVVNLRRWCAYEYDYTNMHKVFDSKQKADLYVDQYTMEHPDEIYDFPSHSAEFEIDEIQVE